MDASEGLQPVELPLGDLRKELRPRDLRKELSPRDLRKELPVIPASSTCNGRTPRGYCRYPAGWGTSHPGKGRCKIHGGARHDPDQVRQPPVPRSLRQAVEERKRDPELLSLVNEIALLRAIQERLELRLRESGEVDPNDPAVAALLAITDKIGKLIERAHRIELERRRLVPADRVVEFMDRLVRAINMLVKDQEVIEALYRIIDEGDEKL